MSVDEVYKLMLYACSKNLQSGYLSPEDFNLTIDQAQTSYLDYLLGEFQQYQYQNPQPRVQFGNNRVARQSLQPLIYGYNLNVDSTGFSPYPGDYENVDTMWSIYGYSRIRYTQQDSLHSYMNSVIDPIATNPIYLIEDNGFRFYPTTLAHAKLSYVRTPPRIFWAYTLDANGIPVYNPAQSEDPVWFSSDMLNIIVRALRIVGVNLQFADVSAYANEIKNGGQ